MQPVSASAAQADSQSAPLFQSAKSYGGAYTDALHDIARTADGGYVVSGYSFGPSKDPVWTHEGGNNSSNNNDAVLMKFDSAHKLQWAQAYGGTGVDVFESIDVLSDGRIVALGRSSFANGGSKIKGVSWYLLLIDPENPDSYTDIRIGGTSGDQGYGVAATSDGGFYAVGWSASKEGYFTSSTDQENYTTPVQLWASYGTESDLPSRLISGGSDSVIVKFDKDAQVEYTVLHNYCGMEGKYNISTPSERVEDISVDDADNLYLSGYNSVTKNAQNAFLAKFSGEDGTLLWHRSAGRADMLNAPADSADYIKATYSGVATLTDGSVVVTGTSTGDATTEEGWQITGTKDTLVVHYSAAGKLLHSENFGTIDDNNSRPEAIVAAPDGGYLLCGSQSGVMQESRLLAKGYRWGNYGGEDGLLVRYSADDAVLWAENFGTNKGDWINGAVITDSGEIIAVGESNGRYGYPTWDNHGGIDGIILTTGVYPDSGTEAVNSAKDGNVVWADGTYTASGSGYAGDDSVSVTLTVEEGKITGLTCENVRDTSAFFRLASSELPDRILQSQSAQVDAVSEATYSSVGLLDATEKALGKAAAKRVDQLIDAIADAEQSKKAAATQVAADAYSELGTYALSQLQNLSALEAAALYNVTLLSREALATEPQETQPDVAQALRFNDAYYHLQKTYFEQTHAYALAEQGYTGEEVRIAVIDSGLTPGHQDLDYSMILDGYNYDDDTPMSANALVDNNGHGTAVAGILAAVSDNEIGVAGLFHQLQIVPLKLTPKKNNDASSALVARAIRDAVDTYQVDVITTSLDVKDTEALRQAVDYAAEQGVLITGASGNSSTSDSDPYIYPASYDNVISVGAVDQKGSVRTNSQKNDQVYVAAPGEDIAVLDLSRSGRCKVASGTSYASPMVAALAVAAKQQDSEINVRQFKYLLRASSMDGGAQGYDTSYGFGIVDYAAFLQVLQSHTFSHVKLDQTELTLKAGESAALTAQVTGDQALLWSTSDDDIATVDETGSVHAVNAGTCQILVQSQRDSGAQAVCTVTVTAAETEEEITLYLDRHQLQLSAGEVLALQASATGETVLRWESTNTSVANVDGSGTVTAVGTGEADIIVTVGDEGLSQRCTVTVVEEGAPNLRLSAGALTMQREETTTLSADITPQDAQILSATWSSSDESVAIVDDSGTVTAIGTGEADITHSVTVAVPAGGDGEQDQPGWQSEEVTAPEEAEGIADTDDTEDTDGIENTADLADTAEAEPAQEVETQLSQEIETSREAASDAVTEEAEITQITDTETEEDQTTQQQELAITPEDTSGNMTEVTLTDVCHITVKAVQVPVTGVTLAPTQLELAQGEQSRLTATVEPEEASNRSVRWSSSDEAVATVNAYGKVTAVASGTASITAASEENGALQAVCAVSVTAAPVSLKRAEVTAPIQTYTGSALEPRVTVVVNDLPVPADGYDVTYSDNVNAGTAVITVVGKGDYTGTAQGTFVIRALTLADAEIQVADQTYTGKALRPALTVTLNGVTLQNGTDYTAAYENNTNVGTATVTVTGIGSYSGTITGAFSIGRAGQTVTASAPATVLVGKTVKVTAKGVGTLTYTTSNAKIATVTKAGVVKGVAPGTATITVKAAGNANYKAASKTVKITVKCATPAVSKVENGNGGVKITWGKVAGAAKYRVFYKTGKGKWQKLADTTATSYTWKKAKSGTAYSFTVCCISKDGKTLTSTYNTKGKSLTYVAAATLSSVKNTKAKTVTVNWKKASGVTGYQIQYSTNKSFKSGNHTVNVKKAAAVSQSISKLNRGKTYYVRIRSYKTVSGKSVYSAWSTVKSVTVKK